MSGLDEELPQEYEQIPWSQLVPVQKDRSLQLAVLVVVIAAALLAIVFMMRRPAATVPVVASTAVPPAVIDEAPGVATPASPASALPVPEPESTVVPQPQIYSEADLMAALPPQPELMAIARAEWFVTDYFTVDGDAALGDSVGAALPDAVSRPATDGSAISYVEWARAVAVVTALDGSFDITVWFRTLVGDSAGGFTRTDVRAVDVRLVTDSSGLLAVADIPGVVSLEPVGVAPPWPAGSVAPPDVIALAAKRAAEFGREPSLESSGLDERGWRLVFSVGDASGLRFPIVVRPPPTGL